MTDRYSSSNSFTIKGRELERVSNILYWFELLNESLPFNSRRVTIGQVLGINNPYIAFFELIEMHGQDPNQRIQNEIKGTKLRFQRHIKIFLNLCDQHIDYFNTSERTGELITVLNVCNQLQIEFQTTDRLGRLLVLQKLVS